MTATVPESPNDASKEYPDALAALDTDVCAEVDADTLVRDAYTLAKPLSGLEIYGTPQQDVDEFVDVLDEFFHLSKTRYDAPDGEFSGVLYISRFKTLPEVATEYNLSDTTNTDLAGVLFGYDLPDVATYASRHGDCD